MLGSLHSYPSGSAGRWHCARQAVKPGGDLCGLMEFTSRNGFPQLGLVIALAIFDLDELRQMVAGSD